MSPAPILLAATGLALFGTVLLPRAGHPVLLVLPPGVSAAAAFGTPGWRVQRLGAAGPFGLVTAAPDGPGADPAQLARVTGALLTLTARPGADCRPAALEPSSP